MIRIYHTTPLTLKSEVQLSKEATQHLVHVLRLRVGETFIIFDGHGGEYHATLLNHAKQAQITVNEFIPINRESPLRIHLGQCLSRGERMDYAIQKSVEAGVHEITPLLSSRCSTKLADDRIEKRLLHWNNIIISACEQSGRTTIPTLNNPQALQDWLPQQTGLCYVADFQNDSLQRNKLIDHVTVLIGPESGLTPEEITVAHQQQFQSLSLGKRTLRTETAAIVAIAKLQCLFGDM